MTIEQQSDLERDDRRHESTQARYARRLKFACCRRCGSADGMQAVHRDTLATMEAANIKLLSPWFSKSGNNEYLFFPCWNCNRDRIIPDGFMSVMTSILVWTYCAPSIQNDPMAPDYEALAGGASGGDGGAGLACERGNGGMKMNKIWKMRWTQQAIGWLGHALEVLYWTVIKRRFTAAQAWRLLTGKSRLVYHDRYNDEGEWK